MAEEEIGARLKLKGRKQFSDDADKAAKSVKGIGDKAAKADRKLANLGRGGLSLAKRGLGGLAGLAKKGALALGALGLAAGVTGVKFIGMAMDAAESASAFNTVFGPAASEVQKFVDTVNQDFGIPTKELQDASRQFGVFAKAAGIPQEGLADFSTSLTQAGLDMASFYNADPSEVFQALQSGLSGEAEPLRKFGIFLSDASLNAYAMAEGINKSVSEMTDSEKVALRQKFILANLGDAQGDLARTSDGLANQWRGFTGRLKEGATAIGTIMLPFVTKLVSALNDKLGPVVADLTKQAPLIAEAFTAAFANGTVASGASRFVTIAGRLGVSARNIWEQWGKVSDAFKSGGIAGVTAQLDDLLGTGDLVSDTVSSVQSIFESLGRIFTTLIIPTINDFNAIIPGGLRPLGMIAAVLGIIASNGKILQPILVMLLAGFVAFRTVVLIIKAITVAQAALNFVMSANPIGLVVIAIAALAAGLIYAWRNSETFRNIVTGAFGAVKSVVVGLWNWFSSNWPLLLAILTGPFGMAVYLIMRNWDTIKGGATAAVDWVVVKFDSLVGFVTGLPERISGAASGMFDGVKSAFKSAINWVIDKWNGLQFRLPAIDIPGIGSVGGGSFGTPDIPRLHTGGTTTTGGLVNMRPDEELIVLPPAASVVPMTDNVRDMAIAMAGGAKSKEPIVMQVVLDRRVIAEAVYDVTEDKVARR